jgi:ribonuclease P protein component
LIDRIHGRAAFQRLQREGTRVRSGLLWCTMVPDRTLTTPQVAFAIGRAVGPAVVRNRLRRQLRALLRSRTLDPGYYLVGVTPGAAGSSFSLLSSTVDDLIARLAAKQSRSVVDPVGGVH